MSEMVNALFQAANLGMMAWRLRVVQLDVVRGVAPDANQWLLDLESGPLIRTPNYK